MVRLLKNGVTFLVATIAAYFFIIVILNIIKTNGVPLLYRTSPIYIFKGGGTWIKFRQFDRSKKWDLIILGSSHAYRGYDPLLFENEGLKTYNLGTSAQHLMCSYHIARNYLNRDNCKMVILDLYEGVFDDGKLESTLDMIQNIDDERTAIEIAMASRDIRAINLLVNRHISNLGGGLLNKDTAGFYKGYLATNKILDFHDKDLNRNIKRYKTSTYHLDYFDRLLGHLKQQGIATVVVEHPLPHVFMVAGHDKFRKDLQPILRKHNVPFYDYTTSWAPGDEKYFKDENHLNSEGVRRFNAILITDLKRDGRIN